MDKIYKTNVEYQIVNGAWHQESGYPRYHASKNGYNSAKGRYITRLRLNGPYRVTLEVSVVDWRPVE